MPQHIDKNNSPVFISDLKNVSQVYLKKNLSTDLTYHMQNISNISVKQMSVQGNKKIVDKNFMTWAFVNFNNEIWISASTTYTNGKKVKRTIYKWH